MKQDFESWWLEVLAYAKENYPVQYDFIAQASFMYEDYWEIGLLPGEALIVEWGV